MTSMKEDTCTQAPCNGLPLSKSSREPSFVQKRKQLGHEQRLTHTTNSNHEFHDQSTDIPTNKALLYKAGYRRVHFDQPTEYRMQFGWPSPDHSPILDAVPTATKPTGADNSRKSDTNSTTSHKYKHIINGAPVNGRTHVIVKEPVDKPKPVRTDIEQEKPCAATRFQEQVERKRNGTHDNDKKAEHKVEKSQLNSKKRSKVVGPTTTEKSRSDQNPSHPSRKAHKVFQERSDNVTHGTKNKENIPDQNPLMVTEYQSTFSRDYSDHDKALVKDQLRNSCHVIGLKDHVKDIIYSAKASHNATPINKPVSDSTVAVSGSDDTTITPVSKYPSLGWVTEYSANFGSPLQMKYVNGVWQGVAQPETLIKSPRVAKVGKPEENISEPSPPSSTTAWFNQVLELRKKVEEFKCRGEEGTQPLFNYSLNQAENDDQDHTLESEMLASTCSSISSITEGNTACAAALPVTVPQQHEITRSSSDHMTTTDESVHQRIDHQPSDEPKGVQGTAPELPLKKPSAPRPGRIIAPVIPMRGNHKLSSNTGSNPKISSKVPKRRDYGAQISSTAIKSPRKNMFNDPLQDIPAPSSVPKHSHSLNDTCQTCGGKSYSHPKPSYQAPSVQSGDCGICNYSATTKLAPTQVSSPSYKKTVPICPPSCPNSSLCREENYSLSPVSATSSCSVARDILERAKHRQNNIWKK